METANGKMKAELRSGITAPFNKGLNEALQFSAQMPFHIENSVVPSQLLGILKGESGTPGLPAALSVVKDDNNLVMLATSPIERGSLAIYSTDSTITGVGSYNSFITCPKNKKWIIKGVGVTAATFVGTISAQTISLFVNGTTGFGLSLITGTTAGLDYLLPQQITLKEGDNLRYRVTTSAYTGGQKLFYIVVQEYDI
jgi:hypothetical protein